MHFYLMQQTLNILFSIVILHNTYQGIENVCVYVCGWVEGGGVKMLISIIVPMDFLTFR